MEGEVAVVVGEGGGVIDARGWVVLVLRGRAEWLTGCWAEGFLAAQKL